LASSLINYSKTMKKTATTIFCLLGFVGVYAQHTTLTIPIPVVGAVGLGQTG
jgi:hypothetical protein